MSLAIEFLSFVKECDTTKKNFLLIDEPDVHLHPDLQDRLAVFIAKEVSCDHITVILSTHSTSFLGALAREGGARVVFMKRGNAELNFSDVSDIHKRILPMFGAHPLSNIFNEAPILLLEGEDDERIWQQSVRSSLGKINIFPCVAGDVQHLGEFEIESNKIIESVYDKAKGYSLRDRDVGSEEITDLDNIIRMKLSCRASENLMLSDDVLKQAGTDWNTVEGQIKNFVQESVHHRYHTEMKKFLDEGLDRKGADLKEIRLILNGLISNKPWEVLIGQTIATLPNGTGLNSEHSIKSYLGEKICRELCKVT